MNSENIVNEINNLPSQPVAPATATVAGAITGGGVNKLFAFGCSETKGRQELRCPYLIEDSLIDLLTELRNGKFGNAFEEEMAQCRKS